MSDDLTIPDWLRMSQDERKAAWERNPPKPMPVYGYVRERTAADQASIDECRAENKALKILKRKARRARKERLALVAQESKSHVGKRWDSMHARWIDPIEEAIMPAAKKSNGNKGNEFGLRPETNYARLVACLIKNKGKLVTLDTLAKAAYGNGTNLPKRRRRVVTMVRRIQTKIVTPKRLPYVLKKEKMDDNAIGIGLFNR